MISRAALLKVMGFVAIHDKAQSAVVLQHALQASRISYSRPSSNKTFAVGHYEVRGTKSLQHC